MAGRSRRSPAEPFRRRSRFVRAVSGGAAIVVALCLAACTAPDSDRATSSARSPTANGTAGGPGTLTSLSITPVTQIGMLTGPGVTSGTITLGLLVDAAEDRGFSIGVELWRSTTNAAGGVCGRAIALTGTGSTGVPESLIDAYAAIGTSVLGFVTETDRLAAASTLSAALTADRIPALTVSGSADNLTPTSPVVLGPTDDIMAINALHTLVAAGVVAAGQTVVAVSDGSAGATNAVDGLRWYAARTNLSVIVLTSDFSTSAPVSAAAAVFSLAAPTVTAELADALPSTTPLVTFLSGYDPLLLTATEASRVQIMLPTPAPGSTHPGATAVEAALGVRGQRAGPLTFAGYATGQVWGRLLTAACDAQTLTREGIAGALQSIGPAPVESLLGPTDPSLPLTDQSPATRTSALAAADLNSATGLRPLTGLVAAPGIDGYRAL
jgi:hypothetical protein